MDLRHHCHFHWRLKLKLPKPRRTKGTVYLWRDESQKLFAKGDTDVKNRLSDSVGEEDGMI